MMFDSAEAISQYLKMTGLGVKAFASMCGISDTAVYHYLKGGIVHRACAEKIEKATRGKLTYESLSQAPRKKSKRRNLLENQ